MTNLKQRPFGVLSGCILAAALLVLAQPAAGDWLVLHDGDRVETTGPWTEKGKLVVFTNTAGALVSLRLSDVDLEASNRATRKAEEMARRPAPLPPPPRPSVFTLTDGDVGHVDDESSESSDQAETETDGSLEEAQSIAVTEWEPVDNATEDGLAVEGVLENRGVDAAAGIAVVVAVYDVDGEQLGSTTAQLGSSALMPGEATQLIADFPGVFNISAVRFDIQQQPFAVRTPEADQ